MFKKHMKESRRRRDTKKISEWVLLPYIMFWWCLKILLLHFDHWPISNRNTCLKYNTSDIYIKIGKL